MPTTNRFGLTAADRAANLIELLAHCAGDIAEPGEWNDADKYDTDDRSALDELECPEPTVTTKWWRSRAA